MLFAVTAVCPRSDVSGKTSNSDVEWRLAGQIPQPQGSPAIEIHRPLTQAELTELDEAAEIINRLSGNDTYARAVQLLDVAERQHGEDGELRAWACPVTRYRQTA